MPMPTPEETAAAEMAALIAVAREDIDGARVALDAAAALMDSIEGLGDYPNGHPVDTATAARDYLEHRRNVRYNNAVAASTGHVLNEARISL